MTAESWQLISFFTSKISTPAEEDKGLPLSEIDNPFDFFLYCEAKNEVKQRKQMVQKCPLVIRT